LDPERPAALEISVDGSGLEVSSDRHETMRATTNELAGGRHVIRLTGVESDTLVRSIGVELIAADG
jgi:hypothetical protein